MSRPVFLLLALLLAPLPFPSPALADPDDSWWAMAAEEAQRDGYRLVDTAGLLAMLGAGEPPLIIDVRADYEYEAGHVAGAVNLEFDLADRGDPGAAKRAAFAALAGEDTSRPMVLYCRNFRCVRSGIAARWAVRMGYTSVYRYPGGLFEWKEAHPELVQGTVPEQRALAPGDSFPDCRLALLSGEDDRGYLGLPPDAKWLSLADLNARFALIQLSNTSCPECVRETRRLGDFFRQVEADPVLAGRLKIFGIFIYDSNLAVVKFRRGNEVPYPLFADRHGEIFGCLGQAQVPLAYLVRARGDGTWNIELVKRGYFEPDAAFLAAIRSAVIRADGTD